MPVRRYTDHAQPG